jgi:ABC-type multidrug transport system fused ATPase/permease subunit
MLQMIETEFKITIELILSVIGSLFGANYWFYNNTKTNLQQEAYRAEHIKLLAQHGFEQSYKNSLRSLLSWLDNIYDNATVIQNYSRHITIALLYSFVVFILFWVLGAEGTIGLQEIMKNIPTDKRIITFITLSLYLIFLYFFYTRATTFTNFMVKRLPSKVQENI